MRLVDKVAGRAYAQKVQRDREAESARAVHAPQHPAEARAERDEQQGIAPGPHRSQAQRDQEIHRAHIRHHRCHAPDMKHARQRQSGPCGQLSEEPPLEVEVGLRRGVRRVQVLHEVAAVLYLTREHEIALRSRRSTPDHIHETVVRRGGGVAVNVRQAAHDDERRRQQQGKRIFSQPLLHAEQPSFVANPCCGGSPDPATLATVFLRCGGSPDPATLATAGLQSPEHGLTRPRPSVLLSGNFHHVFKGIGRGAGPSTSNPTSYPRKGPPS